MEPTSTTRSGFIEELCRSYHAPLVGYLTEMLGSPEAACEAAIASLQAFRETYQPERVFFPRAMLFKVATHFALIHMWRRRTGRWVLRQTIDLEYEECMPDSDALTVDRKVRAERVVDRLTTTIKDLHPALRNVFVLAHVQGKSRREIAATLGVSEKRVDKRMTKALSECRRRLASQGIDLTSVLGAVALIPFACVLGLC